MKLSEAIRAGAKLRPQAFGSVAYVAWLRRYRPVGLSVVHSPEASELPPKFDAFEDVPEVRTCAFGAALEAVGALRVQTSVGRHYEVHIDGKTSALERFPLLGEQVEELPCGCPQVWGDCRETVGSVIPHLNDTHKWRRETIAQWVAWLERK